MVDDEMTIKSALVTGILSNLIEKAIRKKLGYNIDVGVNKVRAIVSDGRVTLHLDANASMGTDELKHILLGQQEN